MFTWATARSYYIVGYLGTLVEYIEIVNSVIMHSTALYKARMKVIIVDFYVCYK